MRPLSDLYPRLLVNLPKASELLVAQKLEDTLIEFLERTRAYQTELAPIDIVAEQAEYALPAPVGYTLVEPLTVRVAKTQVEPRSEHSLDLDWSTLACGYPCCYRQSSSCGSSPDWRYATNAQPRFYFLRNTNGNLRLVAIPDTARTGDEGLIVEAVWKAKLGVTDVDDKIFDDYYATFVNGALARLYSIPEKAWTDLKLAGFHGSAYEAAIAEAEAAMKRSNLRNDRQFYHSVAYA